MNKLSVALLAAKKGGLVLSKKYSSILNEKAKTKIKYNWHEVVTDADIESNKIIKDTIKSAFPDHSIISEESEPEIHKSDYVWYVDPLDGTTNFTMHIPFFCSTIGLTYKNEPILGVVFSPITKELFTAEKGMGAFLNGKPIQVSNNTDIKKTIVNYCHVNVPNQIKVFERLYFKLKTESRDMRRLGSGNLDLCWVACGRNDVYIRTGNIPWDIIPGFVIAKEAGARITDWNDKPWTLKSETLMATNGLLHEKMLDLLR